MTEIAPRIVVDPGILSGKPVVKGTRVPISLVLAQLSKGMGYDEFEREYGVGRDDILAVLSYAAESLAEESVRAVS